MHTQIKSSRPPAGEVAKPSRKWHSLAMFDDLMEEMQRRWSAMAPLPFLSGRSEAPGMWKPSVDLVEEGSEMVLKADLPGVKKEDIEVSLDNGHLVVRGEQKEEKAIEKGNCYRLERRHGSFYRRLALPAQVVPDDLNATFADGVLEIRFPKPIEKEGSGERIAIH